jgi:N-methylhydantoinase A/oxoprolinase/acetone carboxylase beta subunit
MNSYVRPKVESYVGRLQSELQSIGAKADVNILRSDAGLMTTREAARKAAAKEDFGKEMFYEGMGYGSTSS